VAADKAAGSKFKGMSTIAMFKHGRDTDLHKKRGWLKNLLVREGK
jgi:hypothetical protein